MSGHPYTIGERVHPRILIAWIFMRRGADIPAKSTLDKSDDALRSLADEGWMLIDRDTLLRWREIADGTATTLSEEIDRELWAQTPREEARR